MDKYQIFTYFLENDKVIKKDIEKVLLDVKNNDFIELEEIIQKIDYYEDRIKNYILSKKQKEYAKNRINLLKRKGMYIVYEYITKYQAEKNGKFSFKIYNKDGKRYKTVPITWLYNKKGVYIIYEEENNNLVPGYVGYSESNIRKVILRHFQKQEDENEQHRYNIQQNKDEYYCTVILLNNAKNAVLLEQVLIYQNYDKLHNKNKTAYLVDLVENIFPNSDFIRDFETKVRENKTLRRFFSLNKTAYEQLKEEAEKTTVKIIFEDLTKEQQYELTDKFKQLVINCINANIAQLMDNVDIKISELEEIKQPQKDEFLSGEYEDVPF